MSNDTTGGRQLPLFPPPGAHPKDPPRVAPTPPASSSSSLAAAAGAFDDHLARVGKTEHTRRAFASDLRLTMRYLGAGRVVSEIETDDLNQFLSWMLEFREKPCSPKTYSRRVTTLKVFFAWLVEVHAIDEDPAAELVHRRAEAPLPLVLSDEQVSAILEAAEEARTGPSSDARPELLVRLMLDTGLKKGELVRLQLSDIAATATPPSLLVRYDEARWKSKERRIVFEQTIVPVLYAYLDRYAPAEQLFECTGRNLEYILHDLAATAGLPEKTSFATIRWTSALMHYREGMDHDELRERLGLSPVSWSETKRKLDLLSGADA